MKNIKLPKWTEVLPDTAYLGTQEVVCEIFGYSSIKQASQLIKKGLIPKTDFRGTQRVGRKTKLFWTLKTLRNLEHKQALNHN